MENLTEKNKYYYKVVAKQIFQLFGKFFSIFDGQIEFELGQTYFQEAKPNHEGGFYVYADINKAIFSKMPKQKGGQFTQNFYTQINQSLFIAPRTILKVLCSGQSVSYPNGKIAFSYICPIEDLGMPKGYKSTEEGKSLAAQWCSSKQSLKQIKYNHKYYGKED